MAKRSIRKRRGYSENKFDPEITIKPFDAASFKHLLSQDHVMTCFRLPDTPENREFAEEATGIPAEYLIDEYGMLDSLTAEELMDKEKHSQVGR